MKKYIITFGIASVIMAVLYFTGIFPGEMWASSEIICVTMMLLFRKLFKTAVSIVFALIYTALSAFVWTQVPYTETFFSQLMATIIYTFLLIFTIVLFISVIVEVVKMYQEIKNEPR